MPAIELSINGRFYSVACDPGEEERVRQLGQVLDGKASQLGQTASDAQRFLMVSLMLADELDEAKARLSDMSGNANAAPAQGEADGDRDLLVAAVEHLAERIDQIAAALAQG